MRSRSALPKLPSMKPLRHRSPTGTTSVVGLRGLRSICMWRPPAITGRLHDDASTFTIRHARLCQARLRPARTANDTQYVAVKYVTSKHQGSFLRSTPYIPVVAGNLETFRSGAGAHRAYMRILHVQGYQPAFSTIHSAPYLHAYMVFRAWIAMWAADPETMDIFEIHGMFFFTRVHPFPPFARPGYTVLDSGALPTRRTQRSSRK